MSSAHVRPTATFQNANSESPGFSVLIAAVAASPHLSGVSRHAVNLVRCLLLRPEIYVVHLAIGSWQYEAFLAILPSEDRRFCIHQIVAARGGAIARNLWYYSKLPTLAASLRASIVHLSYPAPLHQAAFDCPTVVTLHDLYPYDIPANFGFPKMLFNRVILQQCLRASDSVACVSESTLRQLDMHAPGVALQKSTTIYNCVEAGPLAATVSPIPEWKGELFLLCVAQHRRNKNVVLAIQVFRSLIILKEVPADAQLVIVGIEGPETPHIQRSIRDLSLHDNVSLLHGISSADLEWCYGHCELLLAPSLIEGFGLPIVEAMFHHCRVVCSDIPAFREVGGSYCLYAQLRPNAEENFIAAVRVALRSHKFHASTTDRFSMTRVGEAYVQLYAELMAKAQAPIRATGPMQIGWAEGGRS